MDLKLEENQELTIVDGDFVFVNDNRSQITFQLISQAKGNFKEFPEICININNFLNSNINENIVISLIENELVNDGFFEVDISGSLKDLKITGKRDDI